MMTLRGRTRLTAAPLIGALLLSCSGCFWDSEPARYTAACGVVLDGSGSGTVFDAEAKLKSSLDRFLRDRQCKTLAFAPITVNSGASRCTVGTLDLDPDADATVDRDALHQEERAQALKDAETMLHCASVTNPGSDVYGALVRIASAEPAPKYILVDSDFVQADQRMWLGGENLSSAASRSAVIDRLTASGLPALSGDTVYPTGFGMSLNDNPDQYQDFKLFWTDLLQGKAKAHVDFEYQ